jgi:DNA-binding NarL/FixJ family response regulator
MIRILIADDHAVVRKGLRQIIAEAYPSSIIGEASDSAELIKMATFEKWDVVVSDLNMPGRSGLDALKQIKQSCPRLPVLIMSMYPEEQFAVRVLKAGAYGYLSKTSVHENLVKAIQTALLGKKFITSSIVDQVISTLDSREHEVSHDTLSDREFEVFKLLATGKTVSDIADELCLSSNTVSTYRARIFEKMNLHSNTDLIRYALVKKLID